MSNARESLVISLPLRKENEERAGPGVVLIASARKIKIVFHVSRSSERVAAHGEKTFTISRSIQPGSRLLYLSEFVYNYEEEVRWHYQLPGTNVYRINHRPYFWTTYHDAENLRYALIRKYSIPVRNNEPYIRTIARPRGVFDSFSSFRRPTRWSNNVDATDPIKPYAYVEHVSRCPRSLPPSTL